MQGRQRDNSVVESQVVGMATEPIEEHPAADRARLAPAAPAESATLTGRTLQVLRLIYAWLEVNTFIPLWLPSPLRRKRFGYLVTALAQVLATLATLAVVLSYPNFSFVGVLNFLVVGLIALSWGAVPALVATLTGAALLEVLVLEAPYIAPALGMPTRRVGDLIEVTLFLVCGVIVSVVASRTEGARRRASRRLAQVQAREIGLREANRRMDEFLAMVSHELKNPLAGMKLAAQLARRYMMGYMPARAPAAPTIAEDPPEDPAEDPAGEVAVDPAAKLEKVVGLLDQIERQAGLQDRLIADLVDVSRIQSQRLELAMAPCDLVSVVAQAVEDQRLSWPAREIGLTVERAGRDGRVPVVADGERIGQVVANYLTNALKYSAADKPVRVSVRCGIRAVRVAVRDEGPGLTPAEQAKIWQRFYRAEGVRVLSGSGIGLGMGLHICKSLVERQGGRVGVESAPGKGSAFYFILPLADGK